MSITITGPDWRSSQYRDSLRYLAGATQQRRREGVIGIVDKARNAASVLQRNRFWADAVAIWSGREVSLDTPIEAEVIQGTAELLAPAVIVDAQPTVEVPQPLRDLTENVLSECWASFAEFQRSDAGTQQFPDTYDEWLGEYQKWFNRYLPLVMLDLPTGLEVADKELKDRIDWFVRKAFADDQGSDGLRGTFLDEAWSFARESWAAPRRSLEAVA